MSQDVNTLMEMGFSKNRAERALAKTGYKGVQLAMDWCFAHEDDPDIDDPFEAPKGHVLGATSSGDDHSTAPATGETAQAESSGEAPQQAKSLKCEDCSKLLKSEQDAQAHAARTQHTNFSESTEEIKPLTAEEKAEQLARLQEKLKAKRAERVEEEKQAQVLKEKSRRATGKDMTLAKQKMEEMEMKKIAEQRRREKEDERKARQRVKEQIEKDKQARALKFAKKSEENVAPATTASAAPSAAPAAAAPPKEYDQCRLQLRLPDGKNLVQSFGAKEQLAAVRLFVQMQTNHSGPITLMTSFPRKVFTEEDMEMPLSFLGLVPSAVLIVK